MAKVQLIARLHCWIIEEWLTDWIRRLMEWFVDLPLSSMSPLKPFLRYFPLWATSFFRYHLCCFHLHTYIPSSPSMRYFFLEQPFLWATSVCYKTSLPLPLVWAISPISHFLIASPSPHCLFFEATLLWIISLLFSENIFFSSRISLSSQFLILWLASSVSFLSPQVSLLLSLYPVLAMPLLQALLSEHVSCIFSERALVEVLWATIYIKIYILLYSCRML